MHHQNEKLVSFTPAYESPKIARAYLPSFGEQQEKNYKNISQPFWKAVPNGYNKCEKCCHCLIA